MLYDKAACNLFVDECESHGLEVSHYRGYAGYEGPSVRVDTQRELQDLLRATSVDVRWDGLGQGYIVYSNISGKLKDEDS